METAYCRGCCRHRPVAGFKEILPGKVMCSTCQIAYQYNQSAQKRYTLSNNSKRSPEERTKSLVENLKKTLEDQEDKW